MSTRGDAYLDPEVLIDDLVGDMDELKSELYADFGVRAFDVQVVIRTWSGAMLGEGDYSDRCLTLDPPPLVQSFDGMRWVLFPQGFNDGGEIRITDVSLAYNSEQLTGTAPGEVLAENQQVFYRLTEAHGQGQEDRIFRLKGPPAVDRESNMCWVLHLVDANLPDAAPVDEDPA